MVQWVYQKVGKTFQWEFFFFRNRLAGIFLNACLSRLTVSITRLICVMVQICIRFWRNKKRWENRFKIWCSNFSERVSSLVNSPCCCKGRLNHRSRSDDIWITSRWGPLVNVTMRLRFLQLPYLRNCPWSFICVKLTVSPKTIHKDEWHFAEARRHIKVWAN